jgi:gliding motility associated protien GldN
MKKYIISTIVLLVMGCSLASAQDKPLETKPPRDGAYDKVAVVQRKAIEYPYLREADVFWVKRVWRIIDIREKMNQVFYYPEKPVGNWRSFMTVLMDAMRDRKLTAYDPFSEDFTVPISYQTLMTQLEKADTVQRQRPDPPYETYDTIIKVKFNPIDVKRFRIKEDWIFDKQRSQTYVRVIGICPVTDSYDEFGNFRAVKPLFWINFPEARPILVQTEVFNRFNSASRLSFDDIFWKRMFTSYIYKEDNVYDRAIADYSTGIDTQLESERIKNELLNFEQTLWEY